MTSKKFPPIPPYYPASSEKWDYPRPGVPTPESRDYQKPYPEFPAPVPPTGIQHPVVPAPIFHVELEADRNGQPVADSVGIAVRFRKEHKNVLRDIRELKMSTGDRLKIELVDYRDAKGESRPMYLLDRDAFSVLVMGFTGKDALNWKLAYIDAFNRLEAALRDRAPVAAKVPTVRELAQMVIDAEDRAEAAEALLVAEARRSMSLANQNVGLAQELHTSQDLTSRFREGIHMLTALLGTPDGICLQDAANQLGQPQHAFNEWLGAKGKWIYRSRSKSKRWKPHAYAIAKGWLGDKQYIRHKSSMERMLYTPDMGPVDPNEFYIFREVEIMPAGMIRILQYDDHVSPNTPALKIRRQEYGVK